MQGIQSRQMNIFDPDRYRPTVFESPSPLYLLGPVTAKPISNDFLYMIFFVMKEHVS